MTRRSAEERFTSEPRLTPYSGSPGTGEPATDWRRPSTVVEVPSGAGEPSIAARLRCTSDRVVGNGLRIAIVVGEAHAIARSGRSRCDAPEIVRAGEAPSTRPLRSWAIRLT